MSEKSHDVFVSYASADKKVADALCAILEQRGLRCWIAPRDVVDPTWAAALARAVPAAKAFCCVLSRSYSESPQTAREIDAAIAAGLPIVPLRIEDVSPSGAMAHYLRTIHWMDALTPPRKRAMQRLADQVAALLEIDGEEGRKQSPPSPPQPSRSRLPLVIAVGVAAMALGIWIWQSNANKQPAAGPGDVVMAATKDGDASVATAGDNAAPQPAWQAQITADGRYGLVWTTGELVDRARALKAAKSTLVARLTMTGLSEAYAVRKLANGFDGLSDDALRGAHDREAWWPREQEGLTILRCRLAD